MDGLVEDEKKPFDDDPSLVDASETAEPDPDEHLMLDQGHGKVWLVKVPKCLMERWAAVNREDRHLATLRVYQPAPGGSLRKPRIFLFLPPSPNTDPNDERRKGFPLFDPATSVPVADSEPDWYELDMVNDNVENQIVVAERPKEVPSNSISSAPVSSRARTTILTGRIKHDCALRPRMTKKYTQQMRERNMKYHTPQRTIRMIEDAGVAGGKGGINRLTSGVGVGAGSAFGNLIVRLAVVLYLTG